MNTTKNKDKETAGEFTNPVKEEKLKELRSEYLKLEQTKESIANEFEDIKETLKAVRQDWRKLEKDSKEVLTRQGALSSQLMTILHIV